MKNQIPKSQFDFNSGSNQLFSQHSPIAALPLPCVQSRSLKKNSKSLETSFERQTSLMLHEQVWEASVEYLCFSYFGQFDRKEGLNGCTFSGGLVEGEEGADLEEIIERSQLIKGKEKEHFIVDLEDENELKKFLGNLSRMFKEPIFNQILFVCNWAWRSYLALKSSYKLEQQFIALNFSTILNFHEQAMQIETGQNQRYMALSVEEIAFQASRIAEQISGLLFISQEIKFINLMQAEGQKSKDVRDRFHTFILSIVRGVLLCVEGFFVDPEEDGENDASEHFSPKHITPEYSYSDHSCRKYRKLS